MTTHSRGRQAIGVVTVVVVTATVEDSLRAHSFIKSLTEQSAGRLVPFASTDAVEHTHTHIGLTVVMPLSNTNVAVSSLGLDG